MNYFIGVLFFLYGVVIGSFLNVLIYRVPRKNLFTSSSSFCPNCKHKLSWIDLFPIFSFIFLGGRCRYCKEKISWRYPLIEFLNGVLWTLSFIMFKGDWASIILSCLFFSVLIVISGIDFDISEIPNGLILCVLILAIIRFVLSFFFGNVKWYEYLIGAVCISLPLFVLALFGAMGMGDVRLAFVAGLFLGWKLTLLGALFGVVSGGVVAFLMILTRKKKVAISFAPFLSLGFIISVLFGNQFINAVF